ncbi:GGDEF domain-containing protein [Sulfurimonas sp.]|uniref:GGDEF domain-containing protein n=1 Tax=Sulfurimonas sp. TaxID=2022749 RepID=UPI0026140B8B|nr:GGDEF domain-containing protein [Sulfurimonas sp.]
MTNEKLTPQLLKTLEVLDFAFQPIINIHSGKIYGVEALLRNFQEVGFRSIFSLFDAVYNQKMLYNFDLALRKKAFIKYTEITEYENIKLFYNLDNRLFSMNDFSSGNTKKILKDLNIKQDRICFEISERHEISNEFDLEMVVQHYKAEDFFIAIDDFGVGYAGYKLFYDSTPNIIKIDRFFLQEIQTNLKKKLMVRNITHLAIQLGIKVIAEGIETKEEYLTCLDIGCHFAQGYYIQRPTQESSRILPTYTHVVDLLEQNKRGTTEKSLLLNYVNKVVPIDINSSMEKVIDYFKVHKDVAVVPIINANKEPKGILLESQIKDFLYSPFGISLLLNKNNNATIPTLLNECGHIDVNSSLSTLIELFANNPESTGIIITKDACYYGFLSAKAIINLMHQENIIQARDQNPLTKLPGNTMIDKCITAVLNSSKNHILCYFDLDNFKAFNDVYGFRNGDRIIQLFANILRKKIPKKDFIGHIGGDDFFASLQDINTQEYEVHINIIKKVLHDFSEDAKGFYSKEDREKGFIVAKDRYGVTRKYPLLTVSASILIVSKHCKSYSEEDINQVLSSQKKVAKSDENHLAISCLL